MADESSFTRLMQGVRDFLGFDPSEIQSGVSPRKDFPSADEVAGSMAAYGSPVEPMLTAPARVRSLSLDAAADAYNRGTLGYERPPVAGDIPSLDPKYVKGLKSTEGRVTPETQKALYQAYLAVQRSALAKLGFDPRHMITTPSGDYESSVTGSYIPDNDTVWTQAEYAPSNPVHESMHRGMNILRKEYAGEKAIPSRQGEERTVRQMMLNQYGPVEEERNPTAVRAAQFDLKNFSDDMKRLQEIERMAARLIAQRHPAGPR